MKALFLSSLAVVVMLMTACNNDQSAPAKETTNKADSSIVPSAATEQPAPVEKASIKKIVDGYLQLKNALANDNGDAAATAADDMLNALSTFDKTALTPEQKKTYDDVESELKEHAQHISSNAGKIAHQRGHFEMLSSDMYELVKAVGVQQTLYKDFCPMYNKNKGAFWLSEKKDISNPYLGKKMAECGEVKEEIR